MDMKAIFLNMKEHAEETQVALISYLQSKYTYLEFISLSV